MARAFVSTHYRIDWKPRGAEDDLFTAIETHYHEAQIPGVIRAKRNRNPEEEFRVVKVQTIEELTNL